MLTAVSKPERTPKNASFMELMLFRSLRDSSGLEVTTPTESVVAGWLAAAVAAGVWRKAGDASTRTNRTIASDLARTNIFADSLTLVFNSERYREEKPPSGPVTAARCGRMMVGSPGKRGDRGGRSEIVSFMRRGSLFPFRLFSGPPILHRRV